MSEKVKGYLLGDGLKRGNQMLRQLEKEKINELGTVELFNPWDQKDINDKANNPTAEMIFEKDTKAILGSEVIVADVDNTFVGSTAELGQIWGINFMLIQLHEILATSKDSGEVAHRVEALLREIPVKKVHWQTTDIRDTDIPESGHRRSHSLNQYLYGLMLALAGEAKSFEEILEELKNGK